MIVSRRFAPGDWVVYRKTKHAPKPGPRATSIVPARNGDNYVYAVDKFWVVDEIKESGELLLRTRRGKVHTANPDDPNLRRAGILTRLLYGNRFPAADPANANESNDSVAIS